MDRYSDRRDFWILDVISHGGLLNGMGYFGGFYQEVQADLPFMEEENFRFEPIVAESNFIAVFGGAFCEIP